MLQLFSQSADVSLSPVTCFGWLLNPATDAENLSGISMRGCVWDYARSSFQPLKSTGVENTSNRGSIPINTVVDADKDASLRVRKFSTHNEVLFWLKYDWNNISIDEVWCFYRKLTWFDLWDPNLHSHCSILLVFLSFRGLRCKAQAPVHFFAWPSHRYDSKGHLNCPKPMERRAHMKAISQSVIKCWETGWTSTGEKLSSSVGVSTSPLAVWVALCVTCNLADNREVPLQKRIWCRMWSTAERKGLQKEKRLSRISLFKDQTVKGDHDDAIWMRRNRQPHLNAHVRNLRNLSTIRRTSASLT